MPTFIDFHSMGKYSEDDLKNVEASLGSRLSIFSMIWSQVWCFVWWMPLTEMS